MNHALVEAIGSPFVREKRPCSDAELEALSGTAFDNRVALLLLTRHRRPGWAATLEDRYQHLVARQDMTRSVVASVCRCLNETVPGEFVVFKSLKPYPATPNDTDVLFFGGRQTYERAYRHVLHGGYIFHEWAPQQRTVCDPRGIGRIGAGKKGGTYYIDLYEEVSTDYFAYLDKRALRSFVQEVRLDGVQVPVLAAEPELAIVLFHSVFPERTYQLEHFVLALYRFADPSLDCEAFLRFATDNHLAPAIRASLTLTAALHEQSFGFVPQPLAASIQALGGPDVRSLERLRRGGEAFPHLFSPRLFWTSFAYKLLEWYSARTAIVQTLHLADPRFFMEVVRALRKRLGSTSVYQAE